MRGLRTQGRGKNKEKTEQAKDRERERESRETREKGGEEQREGKRERGGREWCTVEGDGVNVLVVTAEGHVGLTKSNGVLSGAHLIVLL